MTRLALIFALGAAIVALAAFLGGQPGEARIDWLGYRIETSVGILLVAILLLALAALLALLALRTLLGLPGDLLEWRREGRLRRGYRALTRGMVSVAAGDVPDARAQSEAALKHLGEDPLVLLLAAETAQMGGDSEGARRRFADMLRNPETEFLGIRGLLVQALESGDGGEALRLVRRASELRPATAWVARSRLELEIRGGLWSDALDSLERAQKSGAVPAADVQRRRGLLLYLLGLEAKTAGRPEEARRRLELAADLLPGLADVVLVLAPLLLSADKAKAAAKRIEMAWSASTDLRLIPAYIEARLAMRGLFGLRIPKSDAPAKLHLVEELAALTPGTEAGLVAIAEAALEAGMTDVADSRLAEAALKAPQPTARRLRLLAQIADRRGRSEEARRLIEAAADLPPPVHVCSACGSVAERWNPVCATCGGFDTIRIEQVIAVSPVVALPSPPASTGSAPALTSEAGGAASALAPDGNTVLMPLSTTLSPSHTEVSEPTPASGGRP